MRRHAPPFDTLERYAGWPILCAFCKGWDIPNYEPLRILTSISDTAHRINPQASRKRPYMVPLRSPFG